MNPFKTLVISLILLSLPICSLRAQENYQKGFVVTLKNDTIKGFINLREWTRNPSTFSFRNSEQVEVDYTANDIRYFEADNISKVRYVRFVGPVSDDQVGLQDNSTGVRHLSTTDTIFLKIIQEGPIVTLYQYRDKVKSRFFLSYRKQQPEELVYRYYREENNIFNVDTYKTQLVLAARMGNKLSDKLVATIRKAPYSIGSLRDIVSSINGVVEEKKSTGNRMSYFVGAGVTRSSMRYVAPSDWAKNAMTSVYYFPSLSGGFDFKSNPAVGKLVFRGMVTLDMMKNHTISYVDSLKYRDVIDLNVTIYNLNISALVIDNFYNGRKFKAYGGLGIGFNFSRYTNDQLIRNQIYPDHTVTEPIAHYRYNPYWNSLPIIVGVQYQKVDLKFTYTINTPVSNLSDRFFNQVVNYFNASVNYHF